MRAHGASLQLAAIAEPLGSASGAVEEEGDAALPVLGGVAMLRRENIHHRDGFAGEILERGGERAAARKQLALALGEAALADRSDFAPEQALVGDRALLERRELGAAEVGFDLVVVHSRQQDLARR